MGAGGSVRSHQVVARVLKPKYINGQVVVNDLTGGLFQTSLVDPNFVFDIAQANVQDVMDDAFVAPIKRRIWTCTFQVGGVLEQKVDESMQKFMYAGAFPGDHGIQRVALDSEESGIAQILCDNLLVEPLPMEYLSRWRITLLGMRSLKSHMPLGEFRLLFQPRVSAPVAERTVFELMLDLKTAGWNLAKWLPPSSKKRGADFAPAYIPGGPKTWYSGVQPNRSYLQVLVQADHFFLRV